MIISNIFSGSNSAYAVDLMVKLYLGGALNEKNINIVINNLLEDDEPRVRKAALDLLWRLTLLHKSNNSIFLSLVAHDGPHTGASRTPSVAEPTDNSRKINRGRSAAQGSEKKEDPLSFIRVIQIVSAKLKDKHPLVQHAAADIMKEIARLSIASLTPTQRSFLFNQLLSDGTFCLQAVEQYVDFLS